MTPLKFEYTPHKLRSVGGPPNGIIGVAMPDGEPTIVVDPHWDPDGKGTQVLLYENGAPESATAIDVEDAVAACVGDQEMAVLYAMVVHSATVATKMYLSVTAFDLVRKNIDLAESIAVAIDERSRGT